MPAKVDPWLMQVLAHGVEEGSCMASSTFAEG